MRKWITRTAGTALIAAAFCAAGTGIAAADAAAAPQPVSQRLSVWDSILGQTMGPIGDVCNDIGDRTARMSDSVCNGLSDGSAPAPDPADQAPDTQAPDNQANSDPVPQSAPQPGNSNSDSGKGGVLGDSELPLLGNLTGGLGLG